MKELSIDVVNTVAEFLILTFGKTTSLDVKNNLRKLGFRATQSDVSTYLQMLQENWAQQYTYELDGCEVELTFTTEMEKGKSFRVYSFVAIDEDDLDDDFLDDDDDDDDLDNSVTTDPINDPKSYIYNHRNVDSNTLASILGISPRSVAAYKANINR